ncbi:hypothetical protein HNO89_003096 [Sporosarcina luteola]|nr:hypothetical protein [Sporosarcina luteola]
MKRNKKIYMIILFSLLALFLLSTAVFASDFKFGKQFPAHTFVGPYDISGLTAGEAKAKLASDVTALHEEMDLTIVYLDETVMVPAEIVAFNVERSIEEAQPGAENPLYSIVSEDGLETILMQQFEPISFSRESVDFIAAGMADEMKNAVFPRVVYITDYLTKEDQTQTIVATASHSMDNISPALEVAIRNLDGVEIKKQKLFSLIDEIGKEAVAPLTDAELTVLASILYQTVLQTNFTIEERAISSVLPDSINPGFEAAVNRRLDIGFSFRNPNQTNFVLRTKLNAGELQLSIEGLPFVYQYEPYVERIRAFPPRTVKQYSAFIETGQTSVKEVGKNGLEAVVQREKKLEGVLVEVEPLSKDFYAPIPRVELHPLFNEKEDASDGETTDSALESEVMTTNNEGNADSSHLPNESDGDEITSGEPNTNTPSSGVGEQPADLEEGIIYDKGGMPINK